MDGIIATSFIIPGKRGAISKCAMQITSMLHVKPSETIALVSPVHKVEANIINKIKYIGLLNISKDLRPSEIMTSIYNIAINDAILYVDGDISISPSSIINIFDAYSNDTDSAYCSAIKDFGNIDGFVYGSCINEKGKSNPIISDKNREGIDKINCLQYGCILIKKSLLNKISLDGPCSCIEEMSQRITKSGNDMYCVNKSIISYKGLTNLEIEV